MITIFENFDIPDGPQIGDYVICNDEGISGTINTIGRIENYYSSNPSYPYFIRFDDEFMDTLDSEDLSSKFEMGLRKMAREEIKYFSSDRKDLEILLDSEKFNI